MNSARKFGMAFVLVILGPCILVRAESVIWTGALVVVESYTDGNGYYSYTFTSNGSSYVWGLSSDGGIAIRSHGVTTAYTPPGWVVEELLPSGTLRWRFTNGTWYVEDVPVTFAIQSKYTHSALYTDAITNDSYPSGGILGSAYSVPDHGDGFAGFDRFCLLGPNAARLTGMTTFTDNVNLGTEDMYGPTCYVECASNLLSGTWDPVTNFPVAASATNVNVSLSNNTFILFYRAAFK